jgi:hypothetical protein
MFGCLRRVIVLLLFLLLLAAAWFYRDRIRALWTEARGMPVQPVLVPSAELANAAAARLDSLAAGTVDRVSLSEVELQSLLQYRHSGVLPAFIDSARVELDDEQIRLSADVPIDRLPSISELGEAASILPDTSELTLKATLLPLSGKRIALAIDEVTVARIPLPRRMVPAALRRLGRSAEPGLPEDALALPLPRGASSAYVRGDSLVLLGPDPAS